METRTRKQYQNTNRKPRNPIVSEYDNKHYYTRNGGRHLFQINSFTIKPQLEACRPDVAAFDSLCAEESLLAS